MSEVLVTAEVRREVVETDGQTLVIETPLIGPRGPSGGGSGAETDPVAVPLIEAEETARIAADAALQTNIDAKADTADLGTAAVADTTDFDASGAAAAATAGHSADTTGIHGIDDTAELLVDGDARLSSGQLPNTFVAPFHPSLFSGVANVGNANGGKGVRLVVPKTGQLRDFYVWVGTSSGNVCGGVYDTQATRQRLWSSGSIACPAGNSWGLIGDPNVAVNAGDQLDFWLAADNTTATFGRMFPVHANTSTLPAGFWPGSGASPKINGQANGIFPLPTTIAEASIAGSNLILFAMARIS